MVLEEMRRKCQVLTKGFSKRGNEGEAERYREIMRQYGIEIG
jgi:hypothetical protein